MTIPAAASERLEALVASRTRGGRRSCRFVRPRDRAAAAFGPGRARRVRLRTSRTIRSGCRPDPPAGSWASRTSCSRPLYAAGAAARLLRRSSDEIEFTQISRGIAATGTPSRLGEPSGFGSLYTYLVAPAWWLDPTAAWEAASRSAFS